MPLSLPLGRADEPFRGRPTDWITLTDEEPGPRVLSSPLEDFVPLPDHIEEEDEFLRWSIDPPAGFAGRSRVALPEEDGDVHFLPRPDRWRIGLPAWDRYGQGHPRSFEYPYVGGAWWDPYHQNVLKGDFPIWGQNTFLVVNAFDNLLLESRQVPTPTTPYESTGEPGQEEFFGNPNQFFLNNNVGLSVELNHGNGPFQPADWRLRVLQIYNTNYLSVEELAVVNPDVREGKHRLRDDYALEEWFVEKKLADLGPEYDFVSVRAGSQPFVSDFRGFLLADVNRSVRLFGTRHANRDQFNVIWFDQTEKNTNSALNTFNDRHQNTVVANYYRQDFVFPGYTAQVSYHYNLDHPSFKFNDNDFLVRPDPAGVFAPHRVRTHYLGWAGDGHIERVNVSHAVYWALGDDSLNPIAGQPISINAWLAALELSYDRDWMRFRTSYFYQSGDADPNDAEGTGFDTILDHPIFAGGGFSYWQRQQIGLQGVNLTQRQSLVADLRSTKIQGQPNFVNPGLHLFNLGVDADLTPRLRVLNNVNFLWFDQTEVLETFVFQSDIAPFIGVDASIGAEYRPLLNNQVIFLAGAAALFPGEGFNDLYRDIRDSADPLFQFFVDAVFAY